MPSELTDLLREEAAESEPFAAQPWPASAALIERECPDMAATIRLILLSEFPVGIRETLEFMQDLLSEVLDALPTYAARERAPENGAGQGADDDLPGSWRVL